MPASLMINGLVLVISAGLWIACFHGNAWLMSFASHAAGISLVFLPAGLRLLALLVGGGWAAGGIAMGAMLCMSAEFPDMGLAQAATISLVAGFAPYLSLLAACRALGIEGSLSNLGAAHLPVMALAISAGSAAAHNLVFASFGITNWQDFGQNFAAMATGDFIGCLVAVTLAIAALRVWRIAARLA
ncbi:MAG: hypothetical protein RIS17_1920 [Pseudomonadota bacterium]